MPPEPRSPAQRRRDTEHRLAHDVDVWVATASPDGVPHLVPLSFDWDGDGPADVRQMRRRTRAGPVDTETVVTPEESP